MSAIAATSKIDHRLVYARQIPILVNLELQGLFLVRIQNLVALNHAGDGR